MVHHHKYTRFRKNGWTTQVHTRWEDIRGKKRLYFSFLFFLEIVTLFCFTLPDNSQGLIRGHCSLLLRVVSLSPTHTLCTRIPWPFNRLIVFNVFNLIFHWTPTNSPSSVVRQQIRLCTFALSLTRVTIVVHLKCQLGNVYDRPTLLNRTTLNWTVPFSNIGPASHGAQAVQLSKRKWMDLHKWNWVKLLTTGNHLINSIPFWNRFGLLAHLVTRSRLRGVVVD